MEAAPEVPFVSNIKPMPPEKRGPAHLLGERRAVLRRLCGDQVPTIAQLEKHAARFGSEGVAQTAVELGYGLDAVARLIDSCDRADLELIRKQRPNARLDKRDPAETRAKKMLGITDEDGNPEH